MRATSFPFLHSMETAITFTFGRMCSLKGKVATLQYGTQNPQTNRPRHLLWKKQNLARRTSHRQNLVAVNARRLSTIPSCRLWLPDLFIPLRDLIVVVTSGTRMNEIFLGVIHPLLVVVVFAVRTSMGFKINNVDSVGIESVLSRVN
mmetsp:Transcript_20220/g.47360  ORF Transcript_20220/g.47360 Transcript_20220/m.47360 type:complete len:147 (-) Transcript_20220:438-878(-)